MNLQFFKTESFYNALQLFFEKLNIPVNYVAEEPVSPQEILSNTYKSHHPDFQLMDDVYFLGMVDDAAFENNESIAIDKTKSDYDGLIIFGVTLKQRKNNLLPTRSQLAEITRAFNREYHYTPVTVVFKYKDDNNNYIAFANTERLKYKQEWREGEKVGKVSLLRDIDIDAENIHAGHERILLDLIIKRTGKAAVTNFKELYDYWQSVFNVSILSKAFYKELSNWYFWTIKEVTFPNAPNRNDFDSDEKFDETLKEHKGKNVIRLLTRILFIWFIKEKQLIPEELFDEKAIANKLIKDFIPQKPHGIFTTGKQNSQYYCAILQNLFFATLNQEMGKREFRNDGQNRNVTNLMRYKNYFKNPDYFIQLMEDVVPFMNGDLFECLDKPHPTAKGKQGGDVIIYNDGFSDRDDNPLIVPDYLFFDIDEEVDLSDDFSSKAKTYKNAKTRGLLEILKSYKFTITENTPIEEDVALDPELLGKVFENLLASYNPETKTTARKQTGSFYTPREIVNYMVDESLIAYLKNNLKEWNLTEEQLDKDLHNLFSFDNINPFQEKPDLQKQIIKALDKSSILDPACGSGAFPMGILQKMVHILHKVDPKNTEWKQRQIDRVNKAIENLEEIDDAEFREQSIKDLKNQIKDIEDSFENNELDYGRKLYLIENCIYGVDIQSIAAQISKLRFFISLIVDQTIDKTKNNFGVRPLPNLETKFVAANTLIGIEKPDAQLNMFDNMEVKKFETELTKVRHKIFSAKTQKTKRKLREQDKELRNKIADFLIEDGWENQTARQLASWDPYDQNASSPFFDPEWMFGVSNGFDVVIGNPPYIGEKGNKHIFRELSKSSIGNRFYQRKVDIFYFFFHIALDFLNSNGTFTFITTNYYPTADGAKNLRLDFKKRAEIFKLINFNETIIFESAKGQHNLITIGAKSNKKSKTIDVINCEGKEHICLSEVTKILNNESSKAKYQKLTHSELFDGNNAFIRFEKGGRIDVLNEMQNQSVKLNSYLNVNQGILSGADKVANRHIKLNLTINSNKGKGVFVLTNKEIELMQFKDNEISLLKKFFKNSDVKRYITNNSNELNLLYLTRDIDLDDYPNIKAHIDKYKAIIKNRSTERGEMQAALKLGKWWVVFAARDKSIFEGEKIVSPQRSHKNIFAYNNTEWFSSADVYYITKKTGFPISLKYVLGLLNSSLYYQWLYNKGKRKGEMLELYATPLENLPIKIAATEIQAIFELIIDLIIYLSKENKEHLCYQEIIDSMVFEIFFPTHMKKLQIDILQFVEKDIEEVMQDRDFEQLSNEEKESVIAELHKRWSDPESEIKKRIDSFAEKSPDILKPILES